MGECVSTLSATDSKYALVRAVKTNNADTVKRVLLKSEVDLNEADPDDPVSYLTSSLY
jgi:hypothetical protein